MRSFISVTAFATLVIIGCGGGSSSACPTPCPEGFECNEATGTCEPIGTTDYDDTDSDTTPTETGLPEKDGSADTETISDDTDSPDNDDGSDVVPDGDMDTDGMDCIPTTEEPCPYTGPNGTEGVGPCKAGKRICRQDGTWGACSGEVLPTWDLCGDGIDQDCDGTPDNLDQDGDGVTECGGLDCCYTTEGDDGCPDPKNVYPGAPEIPNGLDDNCNDQIDEGLYDCDDEVSTSSADPIDFAKAIGICKTSSDTLVPVGNNCSDWGIIAADFVLPDGSGTPHPQSHAIFTKFGNVIAPKAGSRFIMLTTGFAADPFDSNKFGGKQQKTSTAPGDWLTANNNQFPTSPACGGSGITGSVNDPVMFRLRLCTPAAAKSFSFNLYFFSQEYVKYVCSDYNDFLLTLLDSGYTAPSDHPELANPPDKNLALWFDASNNPNPVGVNLAPAGLFKQCTNGTSDSGTVITTCVGTDELQGTGFETYGGTGWLTTRGNVKGGEVIELRFVIWDTGPWGSTDYIYNSAVLLDNFQWQYEEFKPGTGPS